ncbi:pseudouridine synthase [Uliginosibacterium sp. sgz301328]|uniref:pseudouridine synthase n=1 Tax=Uliginosibacterium sp. sgz301328 TaxID=3243764 RepID=UPI00359D9479
MQLDRILQSQGFGSRRECRALVRDGEVKIGGEVITDPFGEYDTDGFTFEIGEWEWRYAEKVYIALNKPLDVECSRKPKHNPSVYNLLPEPVVGRDVQSVGRLDVDTSGLLLFSDDGQFIHALSSPKRHVTKSYRATIKHVIDDSLIEALLGGVQLLDEPKPVSAISAKRVDAHTLELVVDQGKYHLVRRMVAAAGNRVEALHRFAVGELSLESGVLPQLDTEDWCYLTDKHLALLGYTPSADGKAGK